MNPAFYLEMSSYVWTLGILLIDLIIGEQYFPNDQIVLNFCSGKVSKGKNFTCISDASHMILNVLIGEV